MGAKKIHKLSKICSVFDIIISGGSQVVDFRTENILEKSPSFSSYEEFKKILKKINWNTKRVEAKKPKSSDKGKSKIKSKTKGKKNIRATSASVTDSIIGAINRHNLQVESDNRISAHTWARAYKDLMQNGKIFNRNSLKANIAFSIFFNQLLHIYRSQENNPYTSEDEPVLTLNESHVQKVLLDFIGQLIQCNQILSAKAIHNFLHLGYIAYKNREYNKLNLDSIGRVLAAPLLDGLQFSGKLMASEEDQLMREQTEVEIFASLIKIFLNHPIFEARFNKSKYKNFSQSEELFQMKLKKSEDLLWNTLIENQNADLITSSVRDDCSNQDALKIQPLPLHRIHSQRKLPSTPRITKSSEATKSVPLLPSYKHKTLSAKSSPKKSTNETKQQNEEIESTTHLRRQPATLESALAALSLDETNTRPVLIQMVTPSTHSPRRAYFDVPEEESSGNEEPGMSSEPCPSPHKKHPSEDSKNTSSSGQTERGLSTSPTRRKLGKK